jgi:hypothetical protein
MKSIVAVLLAAAIAVGAVIWFAGRSADQVTSTLLAFPDQASLAVARANATAALPALQAFAAQNGGYAGATVAGLQQINAGIGSGISLHDLSAASYCLQSTIGTATVSVTGAGGAIVNTPCL